MVRVLTTVVALAAAFAHTNSSADGQGDNHSASFGMELGLLARSGYASWTEGSVGKLRHAEDGAVINRFFVDYTGKLADTLNAQVAAEGYDDNVGSAIGLTQAYLEWRPVPQSATRYRLRLGAFYPRISLENVESGWSSPYTLSASAINTWVAEEIRAFGAELSMSRRPASLGGAHQFTVDVAAFGGNDPAGSLLAWKGWSLHDRQSRFGDNLPLPPLPQIQPGMLFEKQDPYVAPFREIDNRVGYYVNTGWRYGQQFLLRAMHYDNRAEPTSIDRGQYGWQTVFEHVGVEMALPGEFGLLAQWLSGSTVMGSIVDGAHMVDVEFDSQYLLLTRAFDKHRIAMRYDHFDVTQNDQTAMDDNSEHGHAWALAYTYNLSARIGFAAEWLNIKTYHGGWVYYGLSPRVTETQLQLTVKLRL